MITPELIGYMRGEIAKGRTREEIHKILVAEGGWTEVDLSEAFRMVIPMEGLEGSPISASNVVSKASSLSWWKIILTIIVVGVFGFSVWFYKDSLVRLYHSLSFFSTDKINKEEDTIILDQEEKSQNSEVVKNTTSVKDCGVGTAPDIKNSLTYEGDEVLSCLGNSALRCENATATLKDDLFPSLFQIIKNQDDPHTCNFRLSYGQDSTLIDITGKRLALQYISCPLNLVKAVDEIKKVPTFSAPNTENLSKYASQIYFYGILGLFMENNVDKNKIQNIGCSGSYIDSVIASYDKNRVIKK